MAACLCCVRFIFLSISPKNLSKSLTGKSVSKSKIIVAQNRDLFLLVAHNTITSLGVKVVGAQQ